MNRREILNELAQIVAITDGKSVSATVAYCPEAAQRAKGLIHVVESWPTTFPPAPFVSDQCAERHHGDCQNGHPSLIRTLCHCACHCPPEAPQQPAEPVPCNCFMSSGPPWFAAKCRLPGGHPGEHYCGTPEEAIRLWHEALAAQFPTEPAPPTARHIDTLDELLELLAGISSDPQVEGLSLAQKASTMALLYAAKALQQIAGDVRCLNENTCEGFDTVCIAIEPLSKALPEIRDAIEDLILARTPIHKRQKAVQSPASPQEPS
jgi:hypothetical protein